MQEILTLTEGKSGLGLPCLPILNSYAGTLYHQGHSLPHPAVLIAKSWKKLADSAIKFLDTYDAGFAAVDKEAHYEVGKAYEDVLYNAAELLESLTVKLANCILPKSRRNEWKPDVPKRWVRHIEGICNQLKHEHNFLVSVDVHSQFGIARGYSLCRYVNDAIKPNVNFHDAEQAFAYGTDLRRIMVHIYLVANAVNNELVRLLGEIEKIESIEDTSLLQRIAKFMPLPFHYQKSNATPIFSLKDGVLSIAESGGYLIPLGSQVQVASRHSGDGRTSTFHVF